MSIEVLKLNLLTVMETNDLIIFCFHLPSSVVIQSENNSIGSDGHDSGINKDRG